MGCSKYYDCGYNWHKWQGLTFHHRNLNQKKESGLSKSPHPRFPFLIMVASSCASGIQSQFDGISVSLECENFVKLVGASRSN